MLNLFKTNFLVIAGIIFLVGFFWKFIIGGLLPIPADTIVGLYHPYRDYYAADYPRGIPFENSLVTDPVRQQYPWRELSISILKEGDLPLWNPYNFAGYPLLANFQSGVFYPLNILFFTLPFEIAWGVLILSQPLLAFIFMFMFLRNLKLSKGAGFIGSVAFALSGFFVSWLEWGNIVSTGLFLPLILLSIDKIVALPKNKKNEKNQSINILIWVLIFTLSSVFSFFAGHIQIFFYVLIAALSYCILRILENENKIRNTIIFLGVAFIFILSTFLQWFTTLKLIMISARSIDQVSTDVEGWFIPWQNLTQFIAPDFFGNPATLNYWGIWNYGEFIGYIGLLPLIFALGAIIFKRDKKTFFFIFILGVSIILAFPSIIANIPFKFSLPFISTSQPTRLMYLIDFSLAVLAAYGFDYFIQKKRLLIVPLLIVGFFIFAMWIYALFNASFPTFLQTSAENIVVTLSNLRLPTLIYGMTLVFLTGFIFLNFRIKQVEVGKIFLGLAILIFAFDIFRFADKYTVFADSKYLYPSTKVIDFLKSQEGNFRIMSTDSSIFPPNFSSIYRIESVDGYDPLFTLRYAELAAAIGRGTPDIDPPFGFNRIITPQNYHTRVIDILNVKYILSLGEIDSEDYVKVFSEGQTSIYENTKFIERVFFASQTLGSQNKYESISKIFENKDNLANIAIVEHDSPIQFDKEWSFGNAAIESYTSNEVIINTVNDGTGYLVLLDSYYPTWNAEIDGEPVDIYITNYNFRGVVVPEGSHKVVFRNSIL